MPAEEHRPQWELCRTRHEKHRRAVFMTLKDLRMGPSTRAEEIEICVGIHYEKLKSSSNGLSRDSLVEICTELVRHGWFEHDSSARVYLDGLEKKRANAADELRRLIEINPRNVIEISDDDSEDEGEYRPRGSPRRPADRDLHKRPSGSNTRIDQTSGRIQKPNQNHTPAHVKRKAKGKGKAPAQLQLPAEVNKDTRSGRGEIARSELRRNGSGIPSNQNMNMPATRRLPVRTRKESLADYYVSGSDLPCMAFKLQHNIMICIQQALEDMLFRFAKRWLPIILEVNKWDTPEACELSLWWTCLKECKVPVEAVRSVTPGLERLLHRLKHVRHCAVHRVPNIPIKSILMMVEDARLLAQALRDDSLVPIFTLWEEALKQIQGMPERSRGQGRVSDAERNFDRISRERREVSRETDDVDRRISILRRDLSRLEQELEDLGDKHDALCIQQDAAQKVLSTGQQASDSCVAIDDEASHAIEKIFTVPTQADLSQQEAPNNALSGLLMGLRDVGRFGLSHPVVPIAPIAPIAPVTPAASREVLSHDSYPGHVLRSGQTIGVTLPVALSTQVHPQTQEQEQNDDDAIEAQLRGSDMRTPDSERREISLTSLQPVTETILGGVAEELGDRDFVSLL